MFNKNYLNHNFEKINNNYYEFKNFKCKKCNILVWYYGLSDKYYYYILDEFGLVKKKFYLILTCEEVIIKNLIE